jgi:hypothetical protein
MLKGEADPMATVGPLNPCLATLGQAVFIYLYLASVLYPRESESEKVPRPGSKITISGISVGGRFGYPTLIIEFGTQGICLRATG